MQTKYNPVATGKNSLWGRERERSKGMVASLFPKLHYTVKRRMGIKREEKEGNAEAHCLIGHGDYHVA